MDKKWKVVVYRSPSGDYPVKQFIDNLEIKAQAKVDNMVKLLQEFGILLSFPHVKKLAGTDLWELRILGRDNLRVLYIAVTGRTFVLLHGFKKKKDKTPQKEIKIAESRLAEYRSRKTNLTLRS
jgi:phage-related protein